MGYLFFFIINVATEKTVFAMPESKIGLFTDVTSNYFFSRLRNNLGLFYALTGYRVKGEEVYKSGLADYFISE